MRSHLVAAYHPIHRLADIISVPPPASAKRPSSDDSEQPSKKSRTGDVVADKDSGPNERKWLISLTALQLMLS